MVSKKKALKREKTVPLLHRGDLRATYNGSHTTAKMKSHYGKNDGDGHVLFPWSHFMFHTVTITVSLMSLEHGRGNICHSNNNGDNLGDVWQRAITIFC